MKNTTSEINYNASSNIKEIESSNSNDSNKNDNDQANSNNTLHLHNIQNLISKNTLSMTFHEITDRKNFIYHNINNHITLTNIEILNNYSFSNFNKLFSSKMRLKDENNISEAKERISAIQKYIFETITDEKESFYKLRRLKENSKKLTKIKIINNLMNDLNILDRELLIMTAISENYLQIRTNKTDNGLNNNRNALSNNKNNGIVNYSNNKNTNKISNDIDSYQDLLSNRENIGNSNQFNKDNSVKEFHEAHSKLMANQILNTKTKFKLSDALSIANRKLKEKSMRLKEDFKQQIIREQMLEDKIKSSTE